MDERTAGSGDDAHEAYRSLMRLRFGGDVEVSGWPRPGPVTDATDAVLREVRRRVAEPVVAAMLAPDELEDLAVCWGEGGDDGDVWVRLVAVGEPFQTLLSSPAWDAPPSGDAEALAARLADQLQDWVCETRFGWGQLRPARYVLPD